MKSILSKVTSTLGLTIKIFVFLISYGTYSLGKKVVKESKDMASFSKDVYGQVKDVIDNS
jgi:hypothetical protein